MQYPAVINRLINLLAQWPTVGPKTAERFALFLLRADQSYLDELAAAISQLKKDLTTCQVCYRLAEHSPCRLCADARRNRRQLCLVAETKDLLAVENSHAYQGLYFVLGGVISASRGLGPTDLRVKELSAYLKNNRPEEIILALNPDVDGETTALYLARLLAAYPCRLTRLARGLPSGASLDYADELTISQALVNRRQYQNRS